MQTSPDARARVINGRYRLDEKIDVDLHGGSTWRAWDLETDRAVTLTELSDLDARLLTTLPTMREAARELQHPHIATVLDHGLGDTPFLVYELIEGETLAVALESGAFSSAATIRLAEQLLWALERAHTRGYVHRYIDPQAIALTRSRDDKVSAKLLGLGTKSRDAEAIHEDLRAVAGLIFRMISGEDPRDPPRRLSEAAPDAGVPALLDEVVCLALSRPSEHLTSAAEMREALQIAGGQVRRPRSGKRGRVSAGTVRSMRRAMNKVHDYQTVEIAAIPAEVSEAIRRSIDTRRAESEARSVKVATWIAGDGSLPAACSEAAEELTSASRARLAPGDDPSARDDGAPTSDAPRDLAWEALPPPSARDPMRRRRVASASGSKLKLKRQAASLEGERQAAPSPLTSRRPTVDPSERWASWIVLGTLLLLAGAVIVALLSGDAGVEQRVRSTAEELTEPVTKSHAPKGALPIWLSLDSEPRGALITERGRILGHTPARLELEGGSHTLTLSLPEYQSQTLTVEALGAQQLTHRVTLRPLPP